MEKTTNYEKALLRIELMKLKQYKLNIENCEGSYREKREMEQEVEDTIKFVEKMYK